MLLAVPIRPVQSSPPAKAIRERIIARLNERGGPRDCSVCGVNDWILGSYTTTPSAAEPNRLAIGANEKVYAGVAMLCVNCGHTVVLNLRLLGFSSDEWASMTLPGGDA